MSYSVDPPSDIDNPNGIDLDRRNKHPRPLSPHERQKLEEFVDAISYSARYSDDEFEYRHVQLPKPMLKVIPREYFDPSRQTLKLLWEEEWRGFGITQSLGWEHYETHEPEPHILLFKLECLWVRDFLLQSPSSTSPGCSDIAPGVIHNP